MDAFEYGAPPHGGLLLVWIDCVHFLEDQNSIRDYIAFPKNNAEEML